jgi:hypothetical protein
MRVTLAILVLALAGCGENPSEQQAASTAPAAAPEIPAAPATPITAASLMPIPTDPAAVKRLQALGYTIHEDEGHLHPPGVNECPAMAGGPVM